MRVNEYEIFHRSKIERTDCKSEYTQSPNLFSRFSFSSGDEKYTKVVKLVRRDSSLSFTKDLFFLFTKHRTSPLTHSQSAVIHALSSLLYVLILIIFITVTLLNYATIMVKETRSRFSSGVRLKAKLNPRSPCDVATIKWNNAVCTCGRMRVYYRCQV